MKRLSVVIPTYNVEDIIQRCLDSLKWADEVIIVDMFSTDRTKEICESCPNVKFYQNKDHIHANYNYGIDKARGDWIMYHDSDEVITPEVRDEITAILDRKEAPYEGFFIPEKAYYFGKWFSFDVPGKSGKPKLFKKGCLRFPVERMHEKPTINGRWGYLTNRFLHYSHPTVSGWIKKMNYYSDQDMKTVRGIDAKKFAWYRWLFGPVVIFFRSYRTCYRYGYHGLVLSLLSAFYNFIQRAKLWEVYCKRQDD